MARKTDLEQLVEYCEEINRTGDAEDIKILNNIFVSNSAKKLYRRDWVLADRLNNTLYDALASKNEELRCAAANLVWEIKEQKMASLAAQCVQDARKRTPNKDVIDCGISALSEIVARYPGTEAYVFDYTKIKPKKLFNLLFLDTDEEGHGEYTGLYYFLYRCRDRKKLETFVKWFLEYMELNYEEGFWDILSLYPEKSLRQLTRNPVLAEVLVKYLKSDWNFAKHWTILFYSVRNTKEVLPYAIESLKQSLLDRKARRSLSEMERYILDRSTLFAIERFAGTENTEDLVVLLRLASRLLDELYEKDDDTHNETWEEYYSIDKKIGDEVLKKIESRCPRKFENEIKRILAKEFGDAANMLPHDYLCPILFNSQLFDIYISWDAEGFYHSRQSENVKTYLGKFGITDDEQYGALYTKKGKIAKRHSKNWRYGPLSPRIKSIESKSREVCSRISELIGNLGITADKTPDNKLIVNYDGETEMQSGKEAIDTLKTTYSGFFFLLEEDAATVNDCSNFLSGFRHWISRASSKKANTLRAAITSIEEHIGTIDVNEERRRFRVEEWRRNIRDGALGCSEEISCCSFPGGEEEEDSIGILMNRSVSMLDYYIWYKKANIRPCRAILAKARLMKHCNGIKIKVGTPVLLIDSVQGQVGGIPAEMQYKAIIDYAKDRGYKYILFNRNTTNSNPIRFLTYLQSVKNMEKLIPTTLHVELIDKKSFVYIEAWNNPDGIGERSENLYGVVCGYLKIIE